MKTDISNSGVFSRQVSLEPIAALPVHFCFQFESKLGSAKDPQAVQRNFEAILGRDDVLALRELLDTIVQS
jgi:hypothetical protein